jgi:hypothetical protein
MCNASAEMGYLFSYIFCVRDVVFQLIFQSGQNKIYYMFYILIYVCR